jgi:hypothetical protein
MPRLAVGGDCSHFIGGKTRDRFAVPATEHKAEGPAPVR